MGTSLGWDGNRLVVKRTGDPLTATYKLNSLAHLLVKRRRSSLDALKSVPTNLHLFYLKNMII